MESYFQNTGGVMRLTQDEREIIKKTILTFIDDAKIYLFGSRVDDNKKGGDIDIYVETNSDVPLKKEITILAKLELNGILRKVDLVVKTPFKAHQAIYDTIFSTKVAL